MTVSQKRKYKKLYGTPISYQEFGFASLYSITRNEQGRLKVFVNEENLLRKKLRNVSCLGI